jgi:hypothetical protein
VGDWLAAAVRPTVGVVGPVTTKSTILPDPSGVSATVSVCVPRVASSGTPGSADDGAVEQDVSAAP